MAKVLIEETTLTAIGDAIRDKEGTTDLVPVNDMATRISAIETGGDEIPEEAFLISGKCNYRFYLDNWTWFLNKYMDKMRFENVTDLTSCFWSCSTLEKAPSTIHVKDCTDFVNMFTGCSVMKTYPTITGTIKLTKDLDFGNMFNNCYYLSELDNLFEDPTALDVLGSVLPTSTYAYYTPFRFYSMRSLRKIPAWWYKFRLNPSATYFPAPSMTIYYNTCYYCYVLDEIINIPVWHCTVAQTSNMFNSTFNSAGRLKHVTFEQTDAKPKWKAQTIDLSSFVGYTGSSTSITGYGSGITNSKEVKDDATYQALKNDPDWFTTNIAYSRYNHDSAVETINSLPDTSEYLATAGGTNTIKFKKASGSKTDGGAIETLTAEEIAVAAAKGWTVTLVS
jgi:hypothetical protein